MCQAMARSCTCDVRAGCTCRLQGSTSVCPGAKLSCTCGVRGAAAAAGRVCVMVAVAAPAVVAGARALSPALCLPCRAAAPWRALPDAPAPSLCRPSLCGQEATAHASRSPVRILLHVQMQMLALPLPLPVFPAALLLLHSLFLACPLLLSAQPYASEPETCA